MSKKLPKHKRLFKQLKARLILWSDISEDDIILLRKYYPFLFKEQ